MKTFRRIMSYGRPYSKYWPPYQFLSVVSLVFALLTVLFENGDIATARVLPEFELTKEILAGLFFLHS